MSNHGALVASLLAWFAAQARDLPWRRTRDPYALWISEVMLQQTQVTTVLPYWERWMRALPDVAALARAPLERVLKLWEGLGYYTRARNLQRAAQQLVTEHGGRFPQTYAEVLALPGIGRYTAGAICSLAYNQPTPVLDGNVTRVLARLFGLRQNVRQPASQRRLWSLAGALTRAAQDWQRPAGRRFPQGWRPQRVVRQPCGALNEALMELGAMVCLPRDPRCDACPVAAVCVARQAGLTHKLPVKHRAVPGEERRRFVFVCERRGRRLVRQRPGGAVNAHLWELPDLEADGAASATAAARSLFGALVGEAIPLLTLRHSITRHRYVLEVCRVRLAPEYRPPAAVGAWLTEAACQERAFCAAHRRILDHLRRSKPG